MFKPATYKRSVTFPASHFNGQEQYATYWALLDHLYCSFFTANSLLQGSHGHDFKIDIELTGELKESPAWLVDDEELVALVKEWSHTNISIHEDFLELRKRATTELMAEVLAAKIRKRNLVSESCHIMVTVHETDEIFARSYNS
jgi:6-pyruvoyl-tetrahydropterin synthase